MRTLPCGCDQRAKGHTFCGSAQRSQELSTHGTLRFWGVAHAMGSALVWEVCGRHPRGAGSHHRRSQSAPGRRSTEGMHALLSVYHARAARGACTALHFQGVAHAGAAGGADAGHAGGGREQHAFAGSQRGGAAGEWDAGGRHRQAFGTCGGLRWEAPVRWGSAAALACLGSAPRRASSRARGTSIRTSRLHARKHTLCDPWAWRAVERQAGASTGGRAGGRGLEHTFDQARGLRVHRREEQQKRG